MIALNFRIKDPKSKTLNLQNFKFVCSLKSENPTFLPFLYLQVMELKL